MQAESRGVVRAVSPKGAMGLMQIMPETWAGLRSRYGLGADPFDPHDNILAGAAYLRELHDRYGAPGFLAAYNAGPGRYEDHLATGRPLPAETRAYVAALAPLLRDDGSAAGATSSPRSSDSWTSSPLFPVRANDASSAGRTSSGDARQTSIHGKAGGGLDGPCATVRRAVCAPVGAGAQAMSCLRSHRCLAGHADRFGCGCRGAEATNPRTAREKAGLRRGACGW